MMQSSRSDKKEIFETMPVMKALMAMAVPTIVSQLIILIYNVTDTWFIGRTNNPYMVAAASMVATVFMMLQAIAQIFGAGGGNQTVSLLGKKQEDEAARTASLTLVMSACAALIFSVICYACMRPLLLFLGASENTYDYARQYLTVVVIFGSLPMVVSNTMAFLLRNVGHSKEASTGLTIGGVLNMLLDPLFMFVILPDGYQVLGAALATLLSNICTLLYFIYVYRKVRESTILDIPRRIERISRESFRLIFVIGVPAGCGVLFFDITNMVLNRLYASYGDYALAAIGIVLKAERLSLNTNIGLCLGMAPLIAYNYSAGNIKRMNQFFNAARLTGLGVSLACVVLYRCFAADIIRIFINNAETIEIGTRIMSVRCFAPPLMFLCFHMVYYMQAVKKGKENFALIFARQFCFNIPLLFLMNHFFGMDGVICTALIADSLTILFSYFVYFRVRIRE